MPQRNQSGYRANIVPRQARASALGGALRAIASALEPLESRCLLSTIALATAADAYVRGGIYADQNFGTVASVQVKKSGVTTNDNTRDTYLKFDLSGAPSSFSSATLRLYGHLNAGGSVSVTAYSTPSTAWIEPGITFSTEPATTKNPLATANVSSATDAWYTWDVSGYVRSQQAAGQKSISLSLRAANTSASYAQFQSAETGSSVPQILFETAGTVPPVVSPPATATPGAPTNVVAAASGSHSISITFSPVPGAEFYLVSRRTPGGTWSTIANDLRTTRFVDTGLTENTRYEYQVYAMDAGGDVAGSAVVSVATDSFKLFNSLSNSADLSAAGIPRLFTSQSINYVSGLPDLAKARQWARMAAGLALDANGNVTYDTKGIIKIAHSPQNMVVDQESGIDLGSAKGRKDMITVIAAIRDEWSKYPTHPEFKNLKVGIFGHPAADPPSDLNDIAKLDDWHNQSDQMAELAQQLDFIVPVLYADTTDQSSFGARMSLLIHEAQRYGKPVYAYIWPEYFEQAQDIPVHELIGAKQWQGILDEVRNEADGAILWGGVHRFDPNDPWAKITLNYLSTPAQPAPTAPANFTVDPIGLHLTWSGVAATSRVRIERSLDGGGHWIPIGETEPGDTRFDDPGYLTTGDSFTPQYRIQAFNPFASSDYTTSDVIHPSRDGFSVNHAYWPDDKQKDVASQGPVATNIWPGRWVEFKDMNFRQDADHVNLYWKGSGATLQIWIDATTNTDGQLVGGVKVGELSSRHAVSDSPLAWDRQSAAVNIPAGTHNVYFVSSNGLVWLDTAEFGAANDASAPPRALSAVSTGAGVKLSWFDASDDETGFRIERSADRGMTWAVVGSAPPNNPGSPTVANSIVTYVDATAGNALYSYRVSSLHGQGAGLFPITAVASGGVVHPVGTKFSADSFDDSIGVGKQTAGQLFHFELGISTHQNELPVVGARVKYTGVDFGAASNRITLDIAPVAPFSGKQQISFYIDQFDAAHKVGSFVPEWNGGWPYYEEQTGIISEVSGVHDLWMVFDDPSGAASIKTLRVDHTSPVPDIQAPVQAGSQSVRLSWQNTSSAATGFIVQWRKVLTKSNPKPAEMIQWSTANASSSDRSWDIKGLAGGTQYEFRVLAKTLSGNRPSVVMRYTTH